jgi:Mrp family chromosome partitioning ATPase
VDSIRQAVERARAGNPQSAPIARPDSDSSHIRNVPLNAKHLESTRIVAHDPNMRAGIFYDMLRTQVLHEMDESGWQFLAITSATAGCGKSVTACNLALSIARLTERSVLLVDMDLKKPKVAEYLGLKKGDGILSLLEGKASLSSVMVEASIGRNKVLVIPGEVCKSGSSEWMASQNMATLLQTIKREFRSRLVIFDMPPMLTGDDVISILPQMEAVLLIAGVGTTSLSDIKQCHKHLKTTPVVRVVVNRVSEVNDAYYGYY